MNTFIKQSLFFSTCIMKRITRAQSSKVKSTEESAKEYNTEILSKTKSRKNDVASEKEKSIKSDLSEFEFKREKKPILAGSSPKKRKHIKIEYDKVSPSKINTKGEESGKPLHWETVLNNLREMRKNRDAPVDSMGCHRCVDESDSPQVVF